MRKFAIALRLIAVHAAVGVGILGAALYFLYVSTMADRAEGLQQLVRSNVAMINAVDRFDKAHNRDKHTLGATGVTLAKIVDAYGHIEGIGDKGEILIVAATIDKIRVVVHQNTGENTTKSEFRQLEEVQLTAPFAAPMLAALAGDSGAMESVSHNGEDVLVAYAPIRGLGFGFLAEVPLSEIRAPFIRAALIAATVGIILILIGVAYIFRQTVPIVEQALENEARFKEFAELAADWFWETDAEHRFTNITGGINIAHSRLSYALGKTRIDIAAEDTTTQRWWDHRSDLNERRPFRGFRYETFGLDGVHRTVIVSGSPIFNESGEFKGYRGTGRDITDIIANQNRLEAAESRLRTTFKAITIGIIQIDESGSISDFNVAAEKIFEYSSKDVIGKNVSMLMPEPDRSRHDSYLRNYFNTGRAKIVGIGREVTGLRRSGEQFPMHLGVAEVSLHGERYFIGSVTDLSVSKAMEERLRRSQKMEAVGQLSGGIAHDFNNLLGIIIGNLDLAKRKIEPESKFVSNIDKAIGAAKRGADLTSRLLGFARISSDKADVTDVNGSIIGLRDLIQKSITSNITIEMDLSRQPLAAEINGGDFEDALINLSMNARDAMPEGGTLTFTTGVKQIKTSPVTVVPVLEPGEYIEISVTDTGVGMPPSIANRIFEPFFTTKPKGKGTGLGLSMVYGFMQRSRGGISVYSEVGCGTTFKMFLPLAGGKAVAVAHGEGKAREIVGGTETILIVDDEIELAEIATAALSIKGYKTVVAHSGAGALQVLEGDMPIDMLFSDVIMPGGINGFELATRALDIRPGLKVLMTTGFEGGASVDAAGSHHRILRKPFDNDELCDQVRAVLDGRPG